MIPFSPPYVDQDIINEVVDTLKSGWITSGPRVKKLEEEVAQFCGIESVICVNSATSGLILALKWFGIGSGDEVIVPSYTYSATALAVLHTGATPVMVDVLDDFTINPDLIKSAINERTKAVIPVDIGGWPSHYDEINSIVEDTEIKKLFSPSTIEQQKLNRILVISDAAHSFGAKYKNTPTGSLVDLTVFSFHAVKNITTAEGGAICIGLPESFDVKEIYDTFKLMSLNGQTKDAYSKSAAGGWKYDIILRGFKMNMPDICAAIGLAQLRIYKTKILPERKRIVGLYNMFFKKFPWAQLPVSADISTESSYHIYALRFIGISEMQRDKMITIISDSQVSVNVHFIPMPMLTLFRNLGYNIDNHKISYDNYSREISLPVYPQLTDNEVEMIGNAIVNAYNIVIGNA